MTKFSPDRQSAFLEFIRQNPGAGSRKVARGLGIGRDAAEALLAAHRAGRLNVPSSGFPAQPAPGTTEAAPSVGARQAGEACELVTENPSTLDDLVKACKVDTKVWRVARHVINKWEVGAQQEGGGVIRTPLFQIKAWLERVPGLDVADALREVVQEIRARPPVAASVPFVAARPKSDDNLCFEFSAPDIHVGKLTWAPEVGASYDLKIAPTNAMNAAHSLWSRASAFPVGRVLIPLGNDFLNVDNAAGTTAGGTPQDEDGRWKKSFQVAIKLAVDLIEFFRGKTPGGVDVLIVPGNHDPERIYYLGCVLEGIYRQTTDVRIDNGPCNRKYFRFGTNLIGFTHGHMEKHDKLPLIMAGERPQDWSETEHREWHLGHLHHSRETRYHVGQEFGPVRVRVLPSLCPADEWHHSSGYVGTKRAAEAYLWSFRDGYAGHLSYNVDTKSAA